MKEVARYDQLSIPTYALSYLVNGDSSGLEDSEIKAIDAYMEQFYREAKEQGGSVIFDLENMEDEGSFTHNPEFGLACDCVDCVILIVK